MSNVCYFVCESVVENFFLGTSNLDSTLAAFSQVKGATSQLLPATFHSGFVLANVTCLGAAEMLFCT